MAVEIISDSRLEVPYQTRIVEPERAATRFGVITEPWQGFFRKLRDLIEAFTPSYLAATSSAFSLGTSGYATGEWAQMTGNSVSLTPGVWRLSGQVIAEYSAGASISGLAGIWATANGNNTTTIPTAVTIEGGGTRGIQPSLPTLFNSMQMPSAQVRVTETTQVFLVPMAAFASPGDAELTVSILAERIQKIKGGT